MMAKRFGLMKKEKLKSRKAIDALFNLKNRFSLAPIQVRYSFNNDLNLDSPVKIGFGCSKKQFKKAVQRNRVKRLMRESYRLQKHHFTEVTEQQKKTATVFFIYTAPTLPDYKLVYETVGKCLKHLEKKLFHESVL
jgi:ribonuclease P protein component